MKFCQCCKLPKGIICSKCRVEKTTDSFHVGKKVCKSCRSKQHTETYVKTRKVKKPELDLATNKANTEEK